MPSRAFRGCARLFCRVFIPSGVLALILLVTASARLDAADPRIYLIERASTNLVTIHFETAANRTYTLQYLNTLKCPTNGSGACSSYYVPTGSWSNLWMAPRLPFTNHYIVTDYITNRMRFYRLKVTP